MFIFSGIAILPCANNTMDQGFQYPTSAKTLVVYSVGLDRINLAVRLGGLKVLPQIHSRKKKKVYLPARRMVSHLKFKPFSFSISCANYLHVFDWLG